MGKKVLVAYFSAGGVTAKVAKELAAVTDADIYEIVPKEKYTAEDLNWQDEKSRSSIEMKDVASRPEIADNSANVDTADVIFLGFPIWWYTATHIINSFLAITYFYNIMRCNSKPESTIFFLHYCCYNRIFYRFNWNAFFESAIVITV